MRKFEVTIKGITPYMQHRMDDQKLEDWEKNRGKIMERPEVATEDVVRAEYHCYRDAKSKQCFIPSEHIRQSLIAAGTNFKSKVGNSRKSMRDVVAAMFNVNPELIFMPDFDEVDKRSAVNKNVKARVVVIRPKWAKGWKATFDLEVEEDSVTVGMLKDILSYSGNYVGIGSYRPTNKGNFGRFEVAELKQV